MKISLAVVGKIGKSFLNTGIDEYTRRLSHYVNFDIQYISDAKNTKSLTVKQQKQQEGVNILASLDAGDYVVLLDEHGREFRSVEFASMLEKRLSASSRDLVFVIGGAYGFSTEVYERASSKISLSKMTFSHQMVRTIFVEQLYRAFTIIRGESYHHE